MRVLVIIVAAIVALFSGAASTQQVALSAPASAPMNSFVDVQWTGPDDSGDYIGIGNKAGKPIPYSGYFYTGNSDGDGRRRIDIAKETLATLLQQTIPDGTPFALRVFGNHEADSCRTDLEVPLAPLDTVSVLRLIDSLQAVNLAKTAIGRSLELVESDLSEADGEHLIILITDGEETCEGDPAAAIATLRAKGIDARVNIVGYAIDDTELEATFADWAELGGGSYFAAGDGNQLAAALLAAAQPSFTVSDADGVVVTRGFAGSEPIILPSGTYEVRSSATSVRAVVRPDKETAVALD